MESFRTEIENPVVEKDIIELEKKMVFTTALCASLINDYEL